MVVDAQFTVPTSIHHFSTPYTDFRPPTIVRRILKIHLGWKRNIDANQLLRLPRLSALRDVIQNFVIDDDFGLRQGLHKSCWPSHWRETR